MLEYYVGIADNCRSFDVKNRSDPQKIRMESLLTESSSLPFILSD